MSGVDLIFKIAGVGIIVAILNILLDRRQGGNCLITTIAGLLVVIFMLIGEIGRLFDTIKSIFGL